MEYLNPSTSKRRARADRHGQLTDVMAKLTPLQRRYVLARFDKAKLPMYQALYDAGYHGSYRAASQMVQRLNRNPLVQAAMKEEGERRLQGSLPQVVDAAQEIVANPKHRDHGKMVVTLLDRTIPKPNEVIHHTHEHTISIEDKRTQLRMLLAQPSLRALLPAACGEPNALTREPAGGARPAVVDAQYTEARDGTD